MATMRIKAKFPLPPDRKKCLKDGCENTFTKGDSVIFKPGSKTGSKGGGSIYCSFECAGDVTPPVVKESEPERCYASAHGNGEGEGVLKSECVACERIRQGEENFNEANENEDSNMGLEATLREMIRNEAGKIEHKATLDEVKVLILEALEKQGKPEPRVLEIKQDSKPPVTIEGGHAYLDRVVKLVAAGIPVYLWGPAGSGKTTAAMQVAKALSRESEIDTLDPSTFRSMIQGYMTPDGKPVHTSFTRCWTEGKLYVADETDNGPGHVQTLFNSALANGHAPLAWGNMERGANFGFVGTGNTPGAPTRAFPDRRPMSAAFKDRLYFVYWPIDPRIEAEIGQTGLSTTLPARKPRKITATAWVEWVVKLRAWAETNMPTLMITPRASILGIKALELGETPAEVAAGLIFRGCDSEMVTKAMNANPWEG